MAERRDTDASYEVVGVADMALNDIIVGVDVSDTTDHATGSSKKWTWGLLQKSGLDLHGGMTSGVGTTETCDIGLYATHRLYLDQNVTITITNTNTLAAGESIYACIELVQDGTGTNTVALAAGPTVIEGDLANIDTAADAVSFLYVRAFHNGTTTVYEVHAPSAGGGGTIELLEEGVTEVAAATSIDFVGGLVTVTDLGSGAAEVAIINTDNRWVGADAMTVYGGCTKTLVGPANQQLTVLSFPNSGTVNTDKATGSLAIPFGWNTAEFALRWAGSAAGSAAVYWTVDFPTNYMADGENINTYGGAATRGGDSPYATHATAYVLQDLLLTVTALNVAGDGGKTLNFQIMRQSLEATDVYTGTALVLGVELRWVS